jgi:hypothetical protein
METTCRPFHASLALSEKSKKGLWKNIGYTIIMMELTQMNGLCKLEKKNVEYC